VAPSWRASSSQYESSPAITALCGPARSRAVCCLSLIPGRRSARRRRARHAACKNGRTERTAVVAGRAPGSATYAPLSVKGRSDKPRGLIRSRALWSAGTRASVVALPRDARERGFLEARALDVSLTSPCGRGSLLQASPRHGWMASRARKAPSCSVQLDATSSTLPAGASPRQAGPAFRAQMGLALVVHCGHVAQHHSRQAHAAPSSTAIGHRRRAPARARLRSSAKLRVE